MEKVYRRFVAWSLKTTTAVAIVAAALLAQSALAQTKITVGKTIGASGFHVPTYVALDKGFYKAEGLDAEFVDMNGTALVKAGLAKQIDFVPIPGGGTTAMLKGAPIVYVVGQSLISQWTITTDKNIKRVEDLKGKIIGLDRPGGAGYDEVVIVLSQNFSMEPGKDYKVISFQAEPDRVAALTHGDIQAAALDFLHAAKAELAGFKVLLRTGEYIPRLGGTVWTHADNLKDKRDVVKKFIKAIAKAEDYIKTNKDGTVDVIQKYFKIDDRKVAEAYYRQVHDKYGPEIPDKLLRVLFDSRALPEFGWPKGKPLPDLNQFVARDLLNEALKEMGRKP